MGVKPSELRKFRREINALFAANEELDSKQSAQIARLQKKVRALEKAAKPKK